MVVDDVSGLMDEKNLAVNVASLRRSYDNVCAMSGGFDEISLTSGDDIRSTGLVYFPHLSLFLHSSSHTSRSLSLFLFSTCV